MRRLTAEQQEIIEFLHRNNGSVTPDFLFRNIPYYPNTVVPTLCVLIEGEYIVYDKKRNRVMLR